MDVFVSFDDLLVDCIEERIVFFVCPKGFGSVDAVFGFNIDELNGVIFYLILDAVKLSRVG